MTNPSDEFKAAAVKLRDLATAASTDNDGTPTAHWNAAPCWPKDDDGNRFLYGDHLTRDDGRTIPWPPLLRGGMRSRAPYMHGQHADYAAAMGPTVGHAVVGLLNAAAAMAVDYPDLARDHDRAACDDYACNLMGAALAVARAINTGGQP